MNNSGFSQMSEQKFIIFVKSNDMSAIDIKKNFHILIDSIDNENILLDFYDMIKNKIGAKDGQLWNRLSTQEQMELLTAFEESKDADNLLSIAELKKKHSQWL
jgi:hypothetical protein